MWEGEKNQMDTRGNKDLISSNGPWETVVRKLLWFLWHFMCSYIPLVPAEIIKMKKHKVYNSQTFLEVSGGEIKVQQCRLISFSTSEEIVFTHSFIHWIVMSSSVCQALYCGLQIRKGTKHKIFLYSRSSHWFFAP